ncbi:MAG: type II toxin-antitoxin system HicA family toxin [Gammaproteobacteria bacterium]|nr:type II toxin-antitoxin system HicA family toxin [Gammaproteobacteria bacterium]
MPPTYYKEVTKILRNAGCTKVRDGKGSHEIWRSPHADKHFTVPTTLKSRHTANGIMKQAGIDTKF